MFLTQVVLDVGSGVGILSLLAAKAGAKMVSQKHKMHQAFIARPRLRCTHWSCQEWLTLLSRLLISTPQGSRCSYPWYISQGICLDTMSCLKVVQGKVEDVEDGAVPMVDVIISDWMGHALFHESLISSVLAARDRWLVQDGLMLPDKAINIILMDVWIHMEAIRKHPFLLFFLPVIEFPFLLGDSPSSCY